MKTATVADRPVEPTRSGFEQVGHCDYVVSPFIGIPRELEAELARVGLETPVLFCDQPGYLQTRAYFFRASAMLALPPPADLNLRVGCLVLRPGGREAHLRVSKLYRWPEQQPAVLGELEQIVLSYCDQWFPDYDLWDAPAEALLPEEVVHPESSGLGRSAASTI